MNSFERYNVLWRGWKDTPEERSELATLIRGKEFKTRELRHKMPLFENDGLLHGVYLVFKGELERRDNPKNG